MAGRLTFGWGTVAPTDLRRQDRTQESASITCAPTSVAALAEQLLTVPNHAAAREPGRGLLRRGRQVRAADVGTGGPAACAAQPVRLAPGVWGGLVLRPHCSLQS